MRVYKSYDRFILDDPRRLIGHDIDFGYWPTVTHPRGARLSWNSGSQDLYLFNFPSNSIVVLAHASEAAVREALDGWERVCSKSQEHTGAWLMSRVRQLKGFEPDFVRDRKE